MYKFYFVFKNTGDWGEFYTNVVIARNEEDAMLTTFRGTREEQEQCLKNWIENKCNISAREMNGRDFITMKVRNVKAPEGYKIKINVSVDIVEEE